MAAASVSVRDLPINGLGLHLEIHGEGPPVILLHGLTGGIRAWFAQTPVFAEHFQVIVLDSRGIGGSQWPVEPYSVDDLADDVVTLLDVLALPTATIVGLSMGGGVAQTLALSHPDRLAALVLVATSSSYPDFVRQRFLDEAILAEERGMAELADRLVDRWLSPQYQSTFPDLTELTRTELLEMDPQLFAIRCRANSTRDLTERLPEIGCPTLFIGGSQERESVAAAAEYVAALPDCTEHIVNGATHFVHQEAIEEFNRVVIDFISSHAAEPTSRPGLVARRHQTG